MTGLVQGGLASFLELVWVVRHLDESFVTLVRDGEVQRVLRAGVVSVKLPARGVSCVTCGAWWVQRGNRTGHCSHCHETFEGGTLWDAHQIVRADGSVICKEAGRMMWRGHRLRKVDGTWRGVGPDSTVFARRVVSA